MAKRKKGLAALVTSRKKKAETESKSNPPPLTDIVEFVVPGFVGYAGTRFASRAIYAAVIKRWPKLAKHASVLSTFGAAGIAWLLVHRVKKISQYHTPVVVGAGIAALSTTIRAYIPKYGWLVSDHDINAAPQLSPIAPKSNGALPAILFSSTTSTPPPVPAPDQPTEEDILADLDDLGSLGDDDGEPLSDSDIDDLLN